MSEIKTAATASFTMNYFSFGKGEKTLVILPGLSVQSVMNSADIIEKAYEIIAESFKVFVFDRRNELPSSYSVYDMADDTAEVFEALGLQDVYIFGASQGGMIGLALASEYPSLVKKLVLGSSAAHITDGQFSSINKWIELARKGDGPELNIEMGKVLYPEAIFKKFKDTLEKMGETITENEFRRFIAFAEGTKGFDVTEKIENIKCPVLSLGSKDDKVLPGAAGTIEKLFSGKKDFESYMYEGFGHAAFDTAPDYKERMLKFLLK